MKTAIVVGATGLVGTQLVQLLLTDTRFDAVKVFVRRTTGLLHSKLQEHIIDFDNADDWKKLVAGDVLYSALGTTLHDAGDKVNQYKVDYTFQYRMAKTAAVNGVKQYVLVSSAGANPSSRLFYSRMKGELDRDVMKLPFETIDIIRPGMLAGRRPTVRVSEKIGLTVMKVIGKIPGLSYLEPIQGAEVARAMINATFVQQEGIHIHTLGEVFRLAHRAD